MTSHRRTPKLHTSLLEVNLRLKIASGAVQRTGIFPPCNKTEKGKKTVKDDTVELILTTNNSHRPSQAKGTWSHISILIYVGTVQYIYKSL